MISIYVRHGKEDDSDLCCSDLRGPFSNSFHEHPSVLVRLTRIQVLRFEMHGAYMPVESPRSAGLVVAPSVWILVKEYTLCART